MRVLQRIWASSRGSRSRRNSTRLRQRLIRLGIEQAARHEIVKLPGHMRQRVRRAVNDLREAPRPSNSRALDIPDDLRIEGVEARRLRLDQWRVVYTIDT